MATSETVNVTVVESKSSETAPPPQLVSQEVPVTRVVEGEPAPVTDSANDSTLQEPASDLAECDMTGLFQPPLFDVLILLITTFPCIFLYIDIFIIKSCFINGNYECYQINAKISMKSLLYSAT